MTSLTPTTNFLNNVSSPTNNANSTPSGVNTSSSIFPSNSSNQTSASMSGLMTSSLPNTQSPAPVYSAPAASVTSSAAPNVGSMYSPSTGVGTQNKADAMYADKILSATASNTSPVPSTAVTTGDNLASAGAKRTTLETMLQDYINQQKAYQDKYLAASTASPEEVALSQKLAGQKSQAALNQETALNSGETSSFAGGEAQRVARTDAIKMAGTAAQLEQLQSYRTNATKAIQDLIDSGDKSFATQLKIQELQNTVSGVDKQAQEALGTLLAKPEYAGVDFTMDPTKNPSENLNAFRKLVATQQSTQKSYTSDSEVSSLYNRGLITGGTESERTARANQIASLPEEQKKQVIQALARGALNTSQQASYQSNQVASSIINSALANMDTDMVNNPYKYLANQYTGYLGGTKDPKYTQFLQLAETANAPIRQGFFGASLTTGENEKANSFLVDTKKDDGKTIVIKLQNMKAVADFANDLMIYDQVGGERPNLDDYLKMDKNGQPKQTQQVEYDDAKAVQQATGMRNPKTGKNFTQEEIDAYKREQGILTNVGSDTNQATVQNMSSSFGDMIGLLQPAKPVEMTSDSLANMGGLMKGVPVLQQSSIEIPESSKLSFVNNNPANLRFAGQIGAVKGQGGFAKFPSPQAGLTALANQINLDAGRGHTLSTFINKFAPPTENDTNLYVKQAMKALGVSKDTPISKIPVDKLVKFMAMKESSTKIY